MVWGFFSADHLSGEDTYYIFAKGTYKVGRKGCDVNIVKDKGVSRVHAEIVVDSMTSALPRKTQSSGVRIRDCSKYGTFVNKGLESMEKIHELPNKETTLREGDLVSFGTGAAVFRFSFAPIILFACCPKKSRANHPLQEKISSIGAHIIYHLSEECSHVLIDHVIPMTEDLLDAILKKKPFVTGSWIELLAEKNILTELPCYTPFAPTITVDGTSVKLADPRIRENCLAGYTFMLDSTLSYRFNDRLQSLLEISGAKIRVVERFKSNFQLPNCTVSDHDVCVLPERSSDDYCDKLGSLIRVNELDLLCSTLNGLLDPSLLKSPCVVVSSSCSTDETVVADSDVEETVTSVPATVSLGTEVAGNVPHEVSINDTTHKSESDFVTSSRRSGDISLRGKFGTGVAGNVPHEISINDTVHKSENDFVMSSKRSGDISTIRGKVGTGVAGNVPHEISLNDTVHKSENDFVMSSRRIGEISTIRGKVDDSESGTADIIYSQDLIVRDKSIPGTVVPSANNTSINFKRFRKTNIQSGNSFNNLIPFSKDPHNNSGYANEEIVQSVEEEKRRKRKEAISEELFNIEQRRRPGQPVAPGTLLGILGHGK